MKKTCIILMLFVIVSTAMAQTAKVFPDDRLYEVMTREEVKEYQEQAPSKLLHLNFQISGFCYVSKIIPENSQLKGNLSEVINPRYTYEPQKIASTMKVNPMKFNMYADSEKYNVYTVDGTNVYVIVYPLPVYAQKQKEYFKKYGY